MQKKTLKMLGDLSYKVVITYLFYCILLCINSNKTNFSLDFYFYSFPLFRTSKDFVMQQIIQGKFAEFYHFCLNHAIFSFLRKIYTCVNEYIFAYGHIS